MTADRPGDGAGRGSALPPLPGELAAVREVRRLSGGMIADVWQAELADGRTVVVKATATDAGLEAEGLEALAEAGAPVPAVLGVDTRILVLEHVEGDGDWARLGRRLAEAHGRLGAAFGWDRDNVIGPLPQDNTRDDRWPRFYAQRRIAPHLDHRALPDEVRRRLRSALAGPLPQLLAHDAPPSLVHGDLWSGNVIDGTYLIDPAVHHADRELDLAFLDLFGGAPDAFWTAYHEVWPLDPGWEARRPALQLYHLLVHVGLFGAGYVRPVVQRLDQLGW